MAGGAAAVAGVAAAGCGPGGSKAPAEATQEVLVIDEADPWARPQMYRTPVGLPQGVAFSLSPAATPTEAGAFYPAGEPTATPTRRSPWSSSLLKQVAASGPSDRPFVGLTIDDGWSSRDQVLAILQQRRVKLSLFLAGRCIAGDQRFVARAINAGCEVANHTMDHYDLTSKSAAYIQDDLQQFENIVKAMVPGATTVPFMRPSGGALNQTVIDASAALGYRPILWNASSGDGATSTTPAQMVTNVLAGAKPGAIILMHFGDRAITALPAIVDGIRAKGLEPVTLTKLFENVNG
jgi:peptidoglycan/xylan/chitin deacetylase (PgdA/CDA1 family)